MATTTETKTATAKLPIELLSEPLKLSCGLTLPNRLVKCPMQETLAEGPYFDPPIEAFSNLYSTWARSNYGLIITGQVQVDSRFLSIAGDVCVHEKSLEPERLAKWKQWASIAQSQGTPCIVQIAHPGRMSPMGAGVRPTAMPALCPSSVPLELGNTWLDKMALEKVLGTPKEMDLQDIDEVAAMCTCRARFITDHVTTDMPSSRPRRRCCARSRFRRLPIACRSRFPTFPIPLSAHQPSHRCLRRQSRETNETTPAHHLCCTRRLP